MTMIHLNGELKCMLRLLRIQYKVPAMNDIYDEIYQVRKCSDAV